MFPEPPTPKKPLPVLYLSGPMSGIEDDNFPYFNSIAAKARAIGFPVINPADFGHQKTNMTYGQVLARDVTVMPSANVIVLLDGWQESNGVKVELAMAKSIGLQVVEIGEMHEFVRPYFDEEELIAWYRDEWMSRAPKNLTVVSLAFHLELNLGDDDDDDDLDETPSPVELSPAPPDKPAWTKADVQGIKAEILRRMRDKRDAEDGFLERCQGKGGPPLPVTDSAEARTVWESFERFRNARLQRQQRQGVPILN